MLVAKILLRWVFWNTLAGSLGALLGTIVFIVILNLTENPEVRRNAAAYTVTIPSMYALPAAVFAGTVSVVQRKMIIPYHNIGGWWIVASAVGSGVGALLGLGLLALSPKAINFVFGASSMSGSLSLGIGLGLGVAQLLHLRGLRFAFLWVAAYLVGMVTGDFIFGLTATLGGVNKSIIIVVAQGVLAWLAASIFTGGTLVYLLKQSGLIEAH